MRPLLIRVLRTVINNLKRLILSTEAGRNLLSDTKNVGTFSQIGEHENMLSDDVRVDGYQEALRRAVQPGDVIVDLGTGTGILSFLAAQQNPAKIYAIDHAPIIEVAKAIADHNNIGPIEFVRSNSRDFSPDEEVDIILHEQMGEGLFNENMIENLLDLKQRILKDGGRILPGKFELFLEPISLRDDHRVTHIWENKLHGIDYSFLESHPLVNDAESNPGQRRFVEQAAVEQFLCEPEPAMDLDLNKMVLGDKPPDNLELSRTAVRDGLLDGVCVYFRVLFDDTHSFDTSPFSRRTSWSTSYYRVPSIEVGKGDTIDLSIEMPMLVDVDSWVVKGSVQTVAG